MTSRLQSISSETIQTFETPLPHSPSITERLPQELLDKIFSNLSAIDLQTVTGVSRTMRACAITSANHYKPVAIKKFVECLIHRLNVDTFQRERTDLETIARNTTPQNFANLPLLKSYILDVKTQLIDIIKRLNDETVNDLSNHVQLPDFFEGIFELAVFERQIDEANRIPDALHRSVVLSFISRALEQAGNFGRAITVATSIPDEDERRMALAWTSRALVQAGNFGRAITVATSIPNAIHRSVALSTISSALMQAGNFDRALTVATSIPDGDTRSIALESISRALAQAGNIYRALTVATSIPNAIDRNIAFRAIFRASNLDMVLLSIIYLGTAYFLTLLELI